MSAECRCHHRDAQAQLKGKLHAVCPMTDKVCEGVAPSQASAWSEDMDKMQGRCAIELPYIQL